MPPTGNNINLYEDVETRKKIALEMANALNEDVGKFPSEITGYTNITEKDIDDMINDKEHMNRHLRAKALVDRSNKQTEILGEWKKENEAKPLQDRVFYPNVSTIMYSFIDPSGTPEAKKKNDELFERVKNEGDTFLLKKAFEVISNFDYQQLFEPDENKKFDIYEKHQDELNIMFAIHRSLANNGMLEKLPKSTLEVYQNNKKLIESASNIKSTVEGMGSTMFLLIPENKMTKLTSVSMGGKAIHDTLKPYVENGFNPGKEPINDVNNIVTPCSLEEENKKIADAFKTVKPKNVLNMTAKIYDSEKKQYVNVTNYEGLLAHAEGKQVIFTEDKNGKDIFKETEFPDLHKEDRLSIIKSTLISPEYNKKEGERLKGLLKKLQDTHTIFSNTRFSTDSEEFENLEDSLERFIHVTEQINKDTFKGPDGKDNMKVYLDAYKNLEDSAGKYYNAKINQSKNDRRQKRFDIAEEIFKSMDSRQIDEAVNGPSKALIAHRQHISVMEASDITNSGKSKDVSKAVNQLAKGLDYKEPQKGQKLNVSK